MKTRAKSKIFKCLRPSTVDEGSGGRYKSFKRCSSFNNVASLGEDADDGSATSASGYPKLLSLLSIRKPDHTSDSDTSNNKSSFRKRKLRGKFSRVLKAVFFEASLSKKLRRSESSSTFLGRSRSSSNLSSKSNCRNESISSKGQSDWENASSRMVGSDCSSLWSSSSYLSLRDSSDAVPSLTSSASSSSLLSRSASEKRRQQLSSSEEKPEERINRWGRYRLYAGSCCLIICLLVLVVWGKTLAIVCISVWLYFAPFCFKIARDLAEIDQDECRTKVMAEET